MASRFTGFSGAVLVAALVIAAIYRLDLSAFTSQQCDVDSGYPVMKALAKAQILASGTWEIGTAAEALLEHYNRELSVFGNDPFPDGHLPRVNPRDVKSLQYALPHIRINSETLQYDNHSVSDPASIGVSALLIGQTNSTYTTAAERQADYLLKRAPKFWNGAISHRSDIIEVWADFGYMVPPTLAYQGVASNSTPILRSAITQCTLYRQALLTNITGSSAGLWHHILGPANEDLGFWSTSNGWAAAGMARVLATVMKWPESQGWDEEIDLLKHYIREILDGAIRVDDDTSTGLLRNYLDDNTWFGEISGTSLLASVAYRMAVLAPEEFGGKYLAWADSKRKAVAKHVNTWTGVGSPAVNSLRHLQREPLMTGSPEGQSFLVIDDSGRERSDRMEEQRERLTAMKASIEWPKI